MGIIAPNLTSDLATLRNDFAAEVLRNIVKDGWSVLNLSAGIADALVDQTGISNLGGATYDGTGHSLGNPGGYVQVNPTGANFGNMTSGGGLAAAFDGTVNQPYSASAYDGGAFSHGGGYVGKAFSSPQPISRVDVYGVTDAGGFTFIAGSTVTLSIYGKASALSGPTDGTLLGTTSFTASSPGGASQLKSINCSGGPYPYVWVCNSSGGGGSTDAYVCDVRYFVSNAPASVAAQSIAFVPAAATSLVRVLALWTPVDSCTLGTDCLMDATANGGTNWSGIALSDLGKFDASTRIIGGMVNVTPGSLVAWRWRTANAKSQLLKGVFVQWK